MIDFKHCVKVAFVGFVFRTKGKHNKHVYIKLIYIYVYIYMDVEKGLGFIKGTGVYP